MKNLFLAVLSVFIMTSCKTMQKNTQSASELFTEDNQWEMTLFQGQTIEEAGFNQKTPHITINKAESKIGGNSGCNSFGGNITIKEDAIEFGPLMSTKMYCDGVPEVEFFQILTGEVVYSIKGKTLLFTKEGKTVMEFQLKEN
ncbi:META domain-containing protein [Carboxylicivirga linearis]|uniref:META domain-containing protein n=1 Tax=Carboxylicivirga linearis TaxID=1628157 RepID=A0ABS5JRE0_9BACT|nr:META domain-containing protein [Carboxylicivirga linearis]MBS2097412.1 META domain-containing protein [Carboxylicivirga linearis]